MNIFDAAGNVLCRSNPVWEVIQESLNLKIRPMSIFLMFKTNRSGIYDDAKRSLLVKINENDIAQRANIIKSPCSSPIIEKLAIDTDSAAVENHCNSLITLRIDSKNDVVQSAAVFESPYGSPIPDVSSKTDITQSDTILAHHHVVHLLI